MTTTTTTAPVWEIFNAKDGRPVTILPGLERRALDYATALGSNYDYAPASRGFYVERSTGTRSDYLIARCDTAAQAQRRADFENMASDAYSFGVRDHSR